MNIIIDVVMIMFVKRLKELRNEAGLTQNDLAKYLSVAQSTIGMWESNKREPDFDMLQKLADFFEVTTDYLLGNEKPTPIQKSALTEKDILVNELAKMLDGVPPEKYDKFKILLQTAIDVSE